MMLKSGENNEIDFLKSTIQNDVNKYLHEKYKIKGNLRLDLEYILSRILILAKKRYHGITVDGRPIIKGLNIVRKDTARFTVIEQQKVGEMRLKGISAKETE